MVEMILWRAPRHERVSHEGRLDPKAGGFYLVDADGAEAGPFSQCPVHPERAAELAEIQLLLAQEPRQ